MPPKVKITKDMIIDAAFNVAREAGAENINARTVAKNLKCSTQPVMYQFETIEELKKAVYAKADRFHTEYRLLEKYGLCKSSVSARRFCYYVPLIILATNNLWNGVTVNCSWFEMVCHICLMLCVGLIEEVIFRGLLFRAIAKDNVKTAIIISSITFGIGHLLNLVNGRGMELAANLFQVVGAIAFGLLFVILFHRSGSLLPCIIAHSAVNILSAFANKTGLTVEKRIAFILIELIIIAVYILILTKTLPEKQVSQS